jgi:hypothetical protein
MSEILHPSKPKMHKLNLFGTFLQLLVCQATVTGNVAPAEVWNVDWSGAFEPIGFLNCSSLCNFLLSTSFFACLILINTSASFRWCDWLAL